MTDSRRITSDDRKVSIVPVVNDAGSAGKTTTAATLAALLAEQGHRVLLVDLDPQGNATDSVGVDQDEVVHTAGSVMLRQVTLAEAVVETEIPNLLLVPANERLRGQRVELDAVTAGEWRLKQALSDVGEIADMVIIDCQAGVGELLPLTALVAATGVLTVTRPSTKEAKGVPKVEQMVEEISQTYNPGLALLGVVPCEVPNAQAGRIYIDVLASLVDLYGDLMTPPVRRSVTAARAYDARTPLPVYAPRDDVTEDYRRVLSDLQAKGVFGLGN